MITKSEKSSGKLKIITTGDGSHSVFNESLNEVYHSTNGAIVESEHIFIKAGFKHVSRIQSEVRILEIGYGTGLNALLTAFYCRQEQKKVEYIALEPYPLGPMLQKKLNYPTLLPEEATAIWASLQSITGVGWTTIHPDFKIAILPERLEEVQPQYDHFDLVYFDAFAPAVQPTLWKPEIFSKLYKALRRNGVLVTYSAKGEVRRSLTRAGFTVERLAGPPGKREMLRAEKKL